MGSLFIACVVILTALLIPECTSAAVCLDDMSPSFTPQQPGTQVPVNFELSGDNLVVECEVTGIPTPSVCWFREGASTPLVVGNNRLSIRINESEAENEASREGTNYYCEATNIIGCGNFKAAVRSRNIRVTHIFVGAMQTTNLETIVNGAVALECDFNPNIPTPTVTWFANDMVIQEMPTNNEILFLEGGRYLYILELTAEQRLMRYHCVVNSSGLSVRSPTTYTLTEDIPSGTVTVYTDLDTVISREREPVQFVYVATGRAADGSLVTLNNICQRDDNLLLNTNNPATITATLRDPMQNVDQVTFTCRAVGGDFSEDIVGTINFSRPESPPNITNPAPDAESLTDQRRLVGGGLVEYRCDVSGSPTPTITWYYNGAVIQSGSGGVVVDGDGALTISAPQVNHSGIYQCFAVNSVGEDSRAWTLEVLNPVIMILSNFWMEGNESERRVVTDNRVVAPSGTANLAVTATVESTFVQDVDTCGFCPQVQWSVNGTNITTDNMDYFIPDVCDECDNSSLYNFTLVIRTLDQDTSGDYSAVFSHPNLTVTDRHQPPIFITVKGPSIVTNLTGPGDVDVGKPLMLKCSIKEICPTQVIWLKEMDNANLTLTNDTDGLTVSPIIDNMSTLTIESVTMEDGGIYRCGTTSDAGVDPGRVILVKVNALVVNNDAAVIGGAVGGSVAGVLLLAGGGTIIIVVFVKHGKKKSGGKKDESNEKGVHYTDPPSSKSAVAPYPNEKAKEAIELNPSDMGATYADPSTIQHETTDTGAMYAVSAKPKKKAKAPKQEIPGVVGDVYSVPDKSKKQKNQEQNLMYADLDVSNNPRRKPPPVIGQQQLNGQDVTYSEVTHAAL